MVGNLRLLESRFLLHIFLANLFSVHLCRRIVYSAIFFQENRRGICFDCLRLSRATFEGYVGGVLEGFSVVLEGITIII